MSLVNGANTSCERGLSQKLPVDISLCLCEWGAGRAAQKIPRYTPSGCNNVVRWPFFALQGFLGAVQELDTMYYSFIVRMVTRPGNLHFFVPFFGGT